MFKLFKKWWKYLTAKLTGSFNERADPKIQLEQAIAEAQNQHRRLREQAANVIANQKQGELRLNAKMTELEKLNANARQALIMASDAEKAGDATKATQYTSAAETIANQLITVEKDVESLKSMVFESAQASDQAKAAVQQNSRLLQEKIAEKSKLLSQLDQAKMQEEMNSAMAQLNESVGADVPIAGGGPGEDPGPLRQGQGDGRAERGLRRVAGARGRAGDGERRGPEPPQRAARRARPRRPRAGAGGRRGTRPPSRPPNNPPPDPPGSSALRPPPAASMDGQVERQPRAAGRCAAARHGRASESSERARPLNTAASRGRRGG